MTRFQSSNSADNMVKAIGVIEVKGIAAAFQVIDGITKAADVHLVRSEKSLGSGLVTIIIEGSTSDVAHAVAVGREIAERKNSRVDEVFVSNPHRTLVQLIEGESISCIHDDYASVGTIEVYGYPGFIAAADAALKNADISIVKYDTCKGKPGTLGLIIILKIYGKVDAVTAAIDAGVKAAEKVSNIILHNVNPAPDIQAFQEYMC